MTTYRNAALAVVWVLSVMVAGLVGAAQAQRQTQEVNVLSGSDLGFRVEGARGSTRVGRLVVRIDGEWVDVEFSGRVRLVK